MYEYLACMYDCSSLVRLVPTETRKGPWIPWIWSYMWMLGMEPWSFEIAASVPNH